MATLAAPCYVPHVHAIGGVTTLVSGHVHYYSAVTGGGVPSPDGTHVHWYSSWTSIADGHTHSYSGTTGPPLPVAGGHTHAYDAITSVNPGYVSPPHPHQLSGTTSPGPGC